MKAWKYLFGFLFLASVSVWLATFSSQDTNLHLIACDVGQGDAILAVYGNTQILTDGGPGNSVLSCLERYIPFWDREIELVVLTHAQEDHYYGLIEVFKRYKVDTFLANSFSPSTQGLKALENAIGGGVVNVIGPGLGKRLRVGMIYLDIVHPELGAFSEDLNDISIVTILSLGNFEALLTGDIGPKATAQMLAKTALKDVDYIKVPHHGSKNGLTQELLEAVRPEIAVISVGGKNSYSHPHQEVLDMLENYGIRIFRTDRDGNVEVISDGKSWWLKN